MDSEDICIWADGTWCFGYELCWYTHMSDDYRRLPFASSEWTKVIDEIGVD